MEKTAVGEARSEPCRCLRTEQAKWQEQHVQRIEAGA